MNTQGCNASSTMCSPFLQNNNCSYLSGVIHYLFVNIFMSKIWAMVLLCMLKVLIKYPMLAATLKVWSKVIDPFEVNESRVSVFTGLDYWNGILEWKTTPKTWYAHMRICFVRVDMIECRAMHVQRRFREAVIHLKQRQSLIISL